MANTNRRRAGLLLVTWLVCLVAAAIYADGWPTDNRIERWGAQLEHDAGWELLREHFGGDEAVLVRLDRFDPAQADLPSYAKSLSESLALAECVDDVIYAPDLMGAWPWDDVESPSGLQVLAQELELWAADPPHLDLVLHVISDSSPASRADFAKQLDGCAEDARARGLRLRAAGHPLVSAALDSEARRVERTFVPFLVLLAALGAWAFLRSPILAGIALLPAASASVGARAAARALLGPSDLILVAAGPICFVLLLAASLHVVLRFQHHVGLGQNCQAAARQALRDKLPASTLAAITTAAGFMVFRTSALRSVSNLGTLVGAAVLLGTPLALFGTTTLLAALRSAPASSVSRARTWRRLAARMARRRRCVAPIGLTLLVAGAFAPAQLGKATNGVTYFTKDHPVRQQFEQLESEGVSLSGAEVLIRRADGTPWSPGALLALGLAQELERIPGATHVIGPEVMLASLPPALAPFAGPELLRQTQRIDADGQLARWTVRFLTGESDETSALIAGMRAAAETKAPGAEIYISGSVPRLHAMQDSLVGTLATSLALTLLVTTLLFLLVVRTPRELLAAIAVNLTPVSAILLAAVLLGIPLDGATTMVGAVVLGLAVDNTFHLLHAAGPAPRTARARLQAFGAVGGAASIGSVSLALGFGTLLLSGFAPTARFGGLCAVGALAAWAADLLLLPALLPWKKP
ncbi:MAG: putative RND superfamily exporter protein [Planctomycetota bacterium]